MSILSHLYSKDIVANTKVYKKLLRSNANLRSQILISMERSIYLSQRKFQWKNPIQYFQVIAKVKVFKSSPKKESCQVHNVNSFKIQKKYFIF
jgi:hypothetical protein